MNTQQGFSLLEVLIAMIVVSIALMAILQGMSSVIQTQTQLNDQAVMQQVAWQQWTALRSGVPMETKQTIQSFEREWLITTQIQPTDFPNTQQVEIEVQSANDSQARHIQFSALTVTR